MDSYDCNQIGLGGIKMEKVLKVEGMSCGHCEMAVKKALNQLDGVDSVDVDLDSKTVEIKGSDLVDTRLKEVVYEAGYDVIEIQ